ncbi:MAG TPA: rhomboid family intramembrane serine protease [Puia sp.]|jgi:membrane associated rhomboid family serine protease|nr:rhomboid family intramembrane serine protease [Puia sp.]
MPTTGIITLILIIINVIVSYRGFKDRAFFARYEFEVEKILIYKDYKRLVTSGFLHINWMHLIFNMLSLYFFSGVVEVTLGTLGFIFIYFGGLIGGHLLSLFIHRHQGDYSAVGASGAVSAVMFASVALYPNMGIGMFFIPISIPSWLYALLFVLFSIYGIRSRRNNVGHDAHLGGALIGMVLALIMQPSAFARNYPIILLILFPTVAFIYIIITRPHVLLVDNLFFRQHRDYYNIDHQYNAQRADQQQEVDRILDKISKKGMRSLNRKERETLKSYSKKVR